MEAGIPANLPENTIAVSGRLAQVNYKFRTAAVGLVFRNATTARPRSPVPSKRSEEGSGVAVEDTVIESNSAFAGIVASPLFQSPISIPAKATVESPYANPELGSGPPGLSNH
jgi:hypothetical protein